MSKKICSKAGCFKISEGSRCERHAKEHAARQREYYKHRRKEFDKKRASAAKRGYGHKWRVASKNFLKQNPFCQLACMERGALTPATIVDHIKPHRQDMQLFWDNDNWQAACKTCHDAKTRRGE